MKKFKLIVCFIMAFALAYPAAVFSEDVPRMTKEKLKGLLGNPNLVILDVRTGKDWDASEFKIKGAIREEGFDISWFDKYPKDKTIVIYCA